MPTRRLPTVTLLLLCSLAVAAGWLAPATANIGRRSLPAAAVRRRCLRPRLQQSGDDGDAEADGADGSDFEADDAFMDELAEGLQRGTEGRPPRARSRAASRGDPEADQLNPLRLTRSLWDELLSSYDDYTDKPSQQFVLGTLSLLVGFWFAQGLTPGVVGQGGYWEYVAGGVTIFIVERITRAYYRRPLAARSPTLRLLNAFKVGFVYGCTLDALKLGG